MALGGKRNRAALKKKNVLFDAKRRGGKKKKKDRTGGKRRTLLDPDSLRHWGINFRERGGASSLLQEYTRSWIRPTVRVVVAVLQEGLGRRKRKIAEA